MTKNKAMVFFILYMTAFDVFFALRYIDTFELWELNPIAIKIYQIGGVPALLLARIIPVLLFFALLPYLKEGFMKRYALKTVFVMHLFLLGWYFLNLIY